MDNNDSNDIDDLLDEFNKIILEQEKKISSIMIVFLFLIYYI